MVKGGRGSPKKPSARPKKWQLRLYIGGQTSRSIRAFQNLKRICEEHMAGNYSIEVIDLLRNPRLAAKEQIVALPTLVRKGAGQVLRMIGDFSDSEKVLAALHVRN